MTAGRQVLFDNYQRMSPRVRENSPVTIVEIDEASLTTLGQWPWPRNRMASLVKAINAYSPAAIGLDMYMPEPDATSPQPWAAELPAIYRDLAREITRLPSHDRLLADELRAAPTVLGAAGFDFDTFNTATGLRTVPMLTSGGDPLHFVRYFPYVLASIPELQQAAKGQAVLSVSTDDAVVRRMPLVLSVGEQLVPSLAMEMLRVATDDPAIRVHVGERGIESVAVADLSVPTQRQGDVWLHFAKLQGSASRQISAADVLAGNVDSDALAGKLVLVGLTGAGLTDQRLTPLGELVPGIEIQAQLLESFFDGRFLIRPWWMKLIELALLFTLGTVMIVVVPLSRGRFAKVITTIPRATTWIVMAMNVSFVLIGYAVFHHTGLLFDAAALFVGFSTVLASLVSSLMVELSKENERLAAEQQRLRDAAHLVGGEIKRLLQADGSAEETQAMERVAGWVRLLGRAVARHPEFAGQLSDEVLDILPRIVALRDLGMVPIAGHATEANGDLSDADRELMRKHPKVGGMAVDVAAKILGSEHSDTSIANLLACTREVAEGHHERWDGKGYPAGLAGEAVPLSARIAGMVDAYEAMVSSRPYRVALSHDEALAVIARASGTQFDPRIAAIFAEVGEEIRALGGASGSPATVPGPQAMGPGPR